MQQSAETVQQIRVECTTSGEFPAWVAAARGSLAVSTYQAHKVAMIGWDGEQVTLLMRQFDKPLGLATFGDRLALASRNELTLFANAKLLAPGFLEDRPGRYDALYLPRTTYHTGDLHVHDVGFVDGEPIFVNTRFSCLARPSHDYHFEPIWRPRFITDYTPDDRCHLNGLAIVGGRPKYVTALGTTNEAGAWRARKADGGVVIDVDADEVVLSGLAMPHSPRWYDGRLWVLNSGAGELLAVDPQRGSADVVATLPGYLRGLCFVGPYAVVGLCKIREKHIFGDLPIQSRFERLRCGAAVVDLRSGREIAALDFTAGCEELYDVQFLPGVLRPMILGRDRPEIFQAMTNFDSSYWLRPSREVRDAAADGTDLGRGRPLSIDSSSSPWSGDWATNGRGEPAIETMGNSLPDAGA